MAKQDWTGQYVLNSLVRDRIIFRLRESRGIQMRFLFCPMILEVCVASQRAAGVQRLRHYHQTADCQKVSYTSMSASDGCIKVPRLPALILCFSLLLLAPLKILERGSFLLNHSPRFHSTSDLRRVIHLLLCAVSQRACAFDYAPRTVRISRFPLQGTQGRQTCLLRSS